MLSITTHLWVLWAEFISVQLTSSTCSSCVKSISNFRKQKWESQHSHCLEACTPDQRMARKLAFVGEQCLLDYARPTCAIVGQCMYTRWWRLHTTVYFTSSKQALTCVTRLASARCEKSKMILQSDLFCFVTQPWWLDPALDPCHKTKFCSRIDIRCTYWIHIGSRCNCEKSLYNLITACREHIIGSLATRLSLSRVTQHNVHHIRL